MQTYFINTMETRELIAIGLFLLGLFMLTYEFMKYRQVRRFRWGKKWDPELCPVEYDEERNEFLIRWYIQHHINARIMQGDTEDKSFQTTLNNIY